MTTRICVIGDSHAAALKVAWNRIARRFPDKDVTFFARGRDKMKYLEVSAGCLIAYDPECAPDSRLTTGRMFAIDADFDAYIICGLGFRLIGVLNLCSTHRCENVADDGRIPLSDECFRCSVKGSLEKTLAIETLQRLRAITAAPAAIIATPLPADDQSPELLKRLSESGEAARVGRLAIRAAVDLSVQNGFTLVLQPEATLAGPLTTNPMYARTGPEKNMHMNSAYGEIVLRAAFADLGFPAPS